MVFVGVWFFGKVAVFCKVFVRFVFLKRCLCWVRISVIFGKVRGVIIYVVFGMFDIYRDKFFFFRFLVDFVYVRMLFVSFRF